MTPLYGHDEDVAKFVSARVEGCARGFGNCRAIGFTDENSDLIAGVIYHNWNPETEVIEMSGAATTPRWLARPVLKEIFDYPFRIGCQMVVMRVSEDNKRLHRQLYACGFKSHKIPRLRGRNEAEIIFTLTDDDWLASKFMKEKPHGQALRSKAA